MARQYNLMSADGHLEVPPERWVHRVPAKLRDRAPHTVHLPDGGDALMIEGQPLLEANFLDLRAGRGIVERSDHHLIHQRDVGVEHLGAHHRGGGAQRRGRS